MPNLDFLIHLPLLRIEEELLPFGPGQLYRMPFSKYDEISLGAFSQQQTQYEATEPVFLSFSVPVSEKGLERRREEVKGIPELKIPSHRAEILDQLGLHAVNWAHQEVGTPSWTALLLAAPAAAFAPPRWSQTFFGLDEDFTIQLPTGLVFGARIQGQADHEYLFLPDAPSEHIGSADVARAAALILPVKQWEGVAEMRAALATLRATGLPVLSPQDRLTIAVQALESLVLPEVHTALKQTFARRVAALLATEAETAERLTAVARDLYSLRSESIHGSDLPDDAMAIRDSLAERLLAAAILAMGELLSTGQTVKGILARLDKGCTSVSKTQVAAVEGRPIGRTSEHRLARRVPSDVFVPTCSMVAQGGVCCWSPLLGLTTEGLEESGGMLLGDPPAPVLMPLSPEELRDLEEKDIRRDYLAAFVQQGHPMAVLMTTPHEDEPADPLGVTPHLERMRDLGVVTLRLAGYDLFHDPELFGSTVFEGSRRLRWPTAVRQTVAEQIRHEATQRIGPADGDRLRQRWREVWKYQTGDHSPETDHCLGLFRRSFDRDFLDPEQRAVILISLMEAMLGRFREKADPVQLEDLVEALAGETDDVAWFRAKGRGFRNRVAHGDFPAKSAPAALERLSRVVTTVVLELIKTWNAVEPSEHRHRPSDLLIASATSQARKLRQ